MDRAQVEKAPPPERLKFTLGPGPIVTRTGGMMQKRDKDRNVQLPLKRPSR